MIRQTTSSIASIVTSLICFSSVAAETTPGDRNLPINQIYPADAFYHNGSGGRILDVTKAPFNAKGDGVTDDTAALCAAMTFVRDNCKRLEGEGYSYCDQQRTKNWTIYLPNGTYLVSDTVSQGWPAAAMNNLRGWSNIESVIVDSLEHEAELNADGKRRVYAEINWGIRIVGQDRRKTIIRLKDKTSGFGPDAKKPVLTFYLLRRGSNVNAGNVMQNITVDTGKGNPGAIGVQWNSSNWGRVDNIAVRSGDGTGQVGLFMDRRNATGYQHDITIDGFDVGISLTGGSETVIALEYATLTRQRKTAVVVGLGEHSYGRSSLSARKLRIDGAPVALRADRASHVVLLDSKLTAKKSAGAAIIVSPGAHLMAQDVDVTGSKSAVMSNDKVALTGTRIDEYITSKPVYLAKDGTIEKSAKSFPRPLVKDWPIILPEQDLSNWANVDHFGAVGDGVADDTAAIQRAMNSGKPVVYFPKANYVINGTVDIPASVRDVTWLFGSVHRTIAPEFDGPAILRVAEASSEPLRLHKATTAGSVFLDHDADRTVVFDELPVYFQHVRGYARGNNMLFPSPAAQNCDVWRLYRNSRPEGAPKEVFVNGSSFFGADNKEEGLGLENVRAWVRMANNEHLPGPHYSFHSSEVWFFGFKAEFAPRLFLAEDGSRLHILGGTFLNWGAQYDPGPTITSRNSSVSAAFLLTRPQETILQSETNGEIKKVLSSQFPPIKGTRERSFVVGTDF